MKRAFDAVLEMTVPGYVEADNRPHTASITVRLMVGRDRSGSLQLTAVDLLDERGDIIFRATNQHNHRRTSQGWEITSEFFDAQTELDEQSGINTWQYTEIFPVNGFLPNIRVSDSQRPQDDNAESDQAAFGPSFHRIWLILRGVRSSIAAFLQSINYLGPIRAAPQRFYYVAGQGAPTPERGKQFVRNLVQASDESLQAINMRLAMSGVRVRVGLHALDKRKSLYELRLEEIADNDQPKLSANISEVGFGLTQMLPIITQAVLAAPGDTLIVEQPELHLHPRAQAELGDLFVAMAQRGVNCLIETHSEHLLLRLRRRIAESSSGIVVKGHNVYLETNDLRAYFIDRVDGMSSLESIPIDALGKMSSPAGFRGFFADDLQEMAKLNQAILNIQADRGKS